jgi:type I restriction enzyme S subunit
MDLPATAFVNQHVALVRPNQAIVYPRYLAFGLHSEIGRTQFKAGEYGGTKQGLGLDDIKSALVLLPSISEQKAICFELDTKIAGLVMAVSRIEHEIALIREYRTRLFADVVTGKLDVRGMDLPEMDEVETQEDWDEDVDVDVREIADVEEAAVANE